MRIWIRNPAICHKNLKICYFRTETPRKLRISHCKFADLRFADWHSRNFRIFDCGMSPRICIFAICRLTEKYACPPLTFKKSIGFQNFAQFFRSLSAITAIFVAVTEPRPDQLHTSCFCCFIYISRH
jgi:hypothetical protein